MYDCGLSWPCHLRGRTVHGFIGHSRRDRIALIIIVGLVATVCWPMTAHAINNPAVTLSDSSTGTTGVTYTFGGYNLGGNKYCSGVTVVFPPGTAFDTLSCTPSGTVAVDGQTVTLSFDPADLPYKKITFTITGVTNPPSGSYNATVIFDLIDKQGGQSTVTVTTPAYSVIDRVLTVSLSSASLYFDLTPEVAAPSQTVTVYVTSSHNYTVTRTISGDDALIGLTVTGAAAGPYAAGTAALMDTYSASVPWTTQGDATYTATVTYTVVQN